MGQFRPLRAIFVDPGRWTRPSKGIRILSLPNLPHGPNLLSSAVVSLWKAQEVRTTLDDTKEGNWKFPGQANQKARSPGRGLLKSFWPSLLSPCFILLAPWPCSVQLHHTLLCLTLGGTYLSDALLLPISVTSPVHPPPASL